MTSSFVKHKVTNGICYLVRVTETSLGRCEEHSPRKYAKPGSKKKEVHGFKEAWMDSGGSFEPFVVCLCGRKFTSRARLIDHMKGREPD